MCVWGRREHIIYNLVRSLGTPTPSVEAGGSVAGAEPREENRLDIQCIVWETDTGLLFSARVILRSA